jgi:hypothetical protein
LILPRQIIEIPALILKRSTQLENLRCQCAGIVVGQAGDLGAECGEFGVGFFETGFEVGVLLFEGVEFGC